MAAANNGLSRNRRNEVENSGEHMNNLRVDGWRQFGGKNELQVVVRGTRRGVARHERRTGPHGRDLEIESAKAQTSIRNPLQHFKTNSARREHQEIVVH